MTPRRAIFLTVDSPFPASDPEKRREAHLIQLLTEQMPVEVLCIGRTREGASAPVTVTAVDPKGEGFLGKQALKKTLSSLKPGELRRTYSTRMEAALRERAQAPHGEKALLWVSRLAMAQYVPLARKLGYQIVLDKQSSDAAPAQSPGGFASIKKFLGIMRKAQTGFLERGYRHKCDALIASSDLHASRILKVVPGARVHIIPHSVNTAAFRELRGKLGNALVFIGELDDPETVDGLTRFAEKVLPRLRASLGTKFPPVIVGGSSPSPEFVEFLRGRGIDVWPDPESSLPLLREAAVVMAPYPEGAENPSPGILEAMAAGRPVVSTVHGIEGLVLSPSFDIWVAYKKDAFASLISRLFQDPQIGAETGARAAETVDSRYDWRRTRQLVEDLVRSLK